MPYPTAECPFFNGLLCGGKGRCLAGSGGTGVCGCLGSAEGEACETCAVGFVRAGLAGCVRAAAPTCFDGVKNGNETGVDCGGHLCKTCGSFGIADDPVVPPAETPVGTIMLVIIPVILFVLCAICICACRGCKGKKTNRARKPVVENNAPLLPSTAGAGSSSPLHTAAVQPRIAGHNGAKALSPRGAAEV